MKDLLRLFVVAWLLLSATSPRASEGSTSSVDIKFKEIVLLTTTEDSHQSERIFATIDITNRAPASVRFSAVKSANRYFIQYGAEAKVQFKTPDDSDWQQTVGAGRDGWAMQDYIVVQSFKTEMAYIAWSPGFLVNYPAGTQFRIGIVDTSQKIYWSPSFKLHDGVNRLRLESAVSNLK